MKKKSKLSSWGKVYRKARRKFMTPEEARQEADRKRKRPTK